MTLRLALLVPVLLLVACAGPQTRETSVDDAPDGAPRGEFDFSRIIHPEPRPEPRSPYGNHSPYEVFGKTYHVKHSAEGYHEQGIASWYGTRFHGRPTSSGEPYDMYKLTAAHRTLPLPTYAEVRNIDNGRSIIVRINDRGPFHSDRIIDLSWAAAVKLGIEQAGTGEVEVRAITFDDPVQTATSPARLPVLLQVGAFSDRERAEAVKARLSEAGVEPVRSESARTAAGSVWRVQVGPLNAIEAVFELAEDIVALGLGRPQYVYP